MHKDRRAEEPSQLMVTRDEQDEGGPIRKASY